MVSGSHASTRALLPPPPPSFSLSPFKNTWCKLTLTSGESRERKERERKGKGIGQRERSRHEKRKFQGLLWGLRNVYTLYLGTRCLTQPLKQQQHHHRLPSPAAPLQQLSNLIHTLWHSVHVLQLDSLLALSTLHLWTLVDLMQHNWLTYVCALIMKGGGEVSFCSWTLIGCFSSSNSVQLVYVNLEIKGTTRVISHVIKI